jgi:hypothetical protein
MCQANSPFCPAAPEAPHSLWGAPQAIREFFRIVFDLYNGRQRE